MALIRKNNSRKDLATGTPFPGAQNRTEDSGIVFTLQIGLFQVKLTHHERDMVVEQWAKMQEEHEA